MTVTGGGELPSPVCFFGLGVGGLRGAVMRIAIIGSGIAGLAAARRLCLEHRVTVFESSLATGGHASTAEVEVDGESVVVDTAFAAFTDRTSPGYAALLRELGVETRAAEGGLAVWKSEAGERLDGAWTPGLRAWMRSRGSAEKRRLRREVAWLANQAWLWRTQGTAVSGTVGGLVGGPPGVSEATLEAFVMPAVAAVLGLGGADARALPLAVFARAVAPLHIERDAAAGWRSVAGGVRAVVRAMVASIEGRGGQVRTRAEVRWVRRSPGSHRYQADFANEGGVEVVSRTGVERFDAVVIATPADVAMGMLADVSAREREVLSSFVYRDSQAVVHTDAKVLPKGRRSAWNVRVGEEPCLRPRLTVDAGMLQGLDLSHGRRVLVTHDDREAVDPKTALRLLRFRRFAITNAAVAAQERHAEISGVSRTFYAGAYWRDGLHEDGLWSGERAAAQVSRWARMTAERT